jgi:soluble lytic murein transglycosylase
MTTVRVRSSGRQILRLSRSFITVFLTVFILHEIVLFSLLAFKDREVRGLEKEMRRIERDSGVKERRWQKKIEDIGIELSRIQEENRVLRVRKRILDTIEEFNPELSQQEKTSLGQVIYEESERYGYDPLVLMAMIMTESSFRPDVRSHKGARGLMQIMPAVGRELSPEVEKAHGIEISSAKDLLDPEVNVKVGSYYLFKLILRFQDLKTAIRAYNEGPTDISKRIRRGKPMPQIYYGKIIRNYNLLKDFSEEWEADYDLEVGYRVAIALDSPAAGSEPGKTLDSTEN